MPPVEINSVKFESIAKARRYIVHRLATYRGKTSTSRSATTRLPLIPDDARFFLALLRTYYPAFARLPIGETTRFIVRGRGPRMTLSFEYTLDEHVERDGGTRAETHTNTGDIDLRLLFHGVDPLETNVNMALRDAVAPQLREFAQCVEATPPKCVAYRRGTTFESLRDAWYAEREVDYSMFDVREVADKTDIWILADADIERDWRDWHAEHATYEIVDPPIEPAPKAARKPRAKRATKKARTAAAK